MRKTILMLAFLMLLSMIPAYADDLDILYWDNHGWNQQNWAGWIADDASGGFTDRNTSVSGIEFSAGDGYQPIIDDIEQSDGDHEVIVIESNAINIYEITSASTYLLEEQILLPTTLATNVRTLDADEDGVREIVALTSDGDVYSFSLDENKTAYNNWNFSTGTKPESGIACTDPGEPTGFDLTDVCYWADNQSTIYEINAITGSYTTYNFSGVANDIFSSQISHRYDPVIIDLDVDASYEVIFTCDPDLDNNIGWCVYDINGGACDSNFNEDGCGISNDGGGADEEPLGMMGANIDSTGSNEVCATYYGEDAGVDKAKLRCRSSSGASFDAVDYFTASGGAETIHGSSPIWYTDRDDGLYGLIGVGWSNDRAAPPDTWGFKLYDASSGSFVESVSKTSSSTTVLNLAFLAQIAYADMDNDGNSDIVTARSIFFYNSSSVWDEKLYTAGSSSYKDGAVSVADANNDGILDIFVSSVAADNTVFISGTATNSPPVINSSLLYGGYTGWYLDAPTCNGTLITFSAAETGASRNYENDIESDREYISTNCGKNTDPDFNLTAGTDVATAPQFACFYDSPGIYYVRLYLKDTANPGDETVYNEQIIPINVILGVEGTTCNIAESLVYDVDDLVQAAAIAAAEAQGQTTDDAVDSTIGLITGGNSKLKTIFGVALPFTFAGAAAGIALHPMIIALGFFVGLIASMLLDLLSPWILVLTILFMILLVIIIRALGTRGG